MKGIHLKVVPYVRGCNPRPITLSFPSPCEIAAPRAFLGAIPLSLGLFFRWFFVDSGKSFLHTDTRSLMSGGLSMQGPPLFS